jgi:hypothetical protein
MRGSMESRFGHDFSRVRVHVDARAAESAQAVSARAYAVGHDVVFDAGEYAPKTRDGIQLLAHELTHVIQQSDCSSKKHLALGDFDNAHRELKGITAQIVPSSKKVSSVPNPVAISRPGDDAEKEAESIANAATASSATFLRVRERTPLSTLARDNADPYAETVPHILSVSPDTVTVINAAGMAENVPMADFRDSWQPRNPGNPALRFSNQAYERAWHEILAGAGIPVSVLTPGLSIELADAPPGATPEDRVKAWLAKYKDAIVAMEATFLVDRRAIAGAIAWEALENVQALYGMGAARFRGAGKVHYKEHYFWEGEPPAKQVEERGYLPRQTKESRERLVAEPTSAIAYIGAIMSAYVDEAGTAGYNLRCQPELLATFYNGIKVAKNLTAAHTFFQTKKAPEVLQRNPTMGKWVAEHLSFLEQAVGVPDPSVCGSAPKSPSR